MHGHDGMRRFIAVVGLSILFGCASDRYTYAPVFTTGADVSGEPAATYPIPPEAPRGDVRVATFGIAPLRSQGLEDSTLQAIHMALVVSNRSDETWSVDAAEQRVVLTGAGTPQSSIDATTIEGTRPPSVEIPARTTKWVDLLFPLPFGLQNARAIPSFDAIWTVRVGSRAITKRTPFERFLAERPSPDTAERVSPERFGSEPLGSPAEPLYRWPLPSPVP